MDKLVQTALEVVELLKNDFSAAIQDIEQIVTTRKRDHTLVTELDFRIEKKSDNYCQLKLLISQFWERKKELMIISLVRVGLWIQ